jgi:hypothetical protein
MVPEVSIREHTILTPALGERGILSGLGENSVLLGRYRSSLGIGLEISETDYEDLEGVIPLCGKIIYLV